MIVIENTKNVGDCVIFVEWIIPKNTLNEEDVDHYIVEFPSGNITSLNSYVTFVPHIHKCTNDIITRSRTVNCCDNVGDYSEDIKPKLSGQDAVAGSTILLTIIGGILAGIGLLFIVAAIVTIVVFIRCVHVYRAEIAVRHTPLRNQVPIAADQETELVQQQEEVQTNGHGPND